MSAQRGRSRKRNICIVLLWIPGYGAGTRNYGTGKGGAHHEHLYMSLHSTVCLASSPYLTPRRRRRIVDAREIALQV